MGKEIERKFLVSGDFKVDATGSREILQGYLVTDPGKTIRIRITDQEAFITIKNKAKEGSFSRGEWEYRIPVEDARELLLLCLPGRIEKTRYLVPAGKHTFEVDVFHGSHEGLIIAEIELDNESEYFSKPGWLGVRPASRG